MGRKSATSEATSRTAVSAMGPASRFFSADILALNLSSRFMETPLRGAGEKPAPQSSFNLLIVPKTAGSAKSRSPADPMGARGCGTKAGVGFWDCPRSV